MVAQGASSGASFSGSTNWAPRHAHGSMPQAVPSIAHGIACPWGLFQTDKPGRRRVLSVEASMLTT